MSTSSSTIPEALYACLQGAAWNLCLSWGHFSRLTLFPCLFFVVALLQFFNFSLILTKRRWWTVVTSAPLFTFTYCKDHLNCLAMQNGFVYSSVGKMLPKKMIKLFTVQKSANLLPFSFISLSLFFYLWMIMPSIIWSDLGIEVTHEDVAIFPWTWLRCRVVCHRSDVWFYIVVVGWCIALDDIHLDLLCDPEGWCDVSWSMRCYPMLFGQVLSEWV